MNRSYASRSHSEANDSPTSSWSDKTKRTPGAAIQAQNDTATQPITVENAISLENGVEAEKCKSESQQEESIKYDVIQEKMKQSPTSIPGLFEPHSANQMGQLPENVWEEVAQCQGGAQAEQERNNPVLQRFSAGQFEDPGLAPILRGRGYLQHLPSNAWVPNTGLGAKKENALRALDNDALGNNANAIWG